MKKLKTQLETTTDTHTYTRARISLVTGCCLNCKRRGRKFERCWKSHRKNKWKE